MGACAKWLDAWETCIKVWRATGSCRAESGGPGCSAAKSGLNSRRGCTAGDEGLQSGKGGRAAVGWTACEEREVTRAASGHGMRELHGWSTSCIPRASRAEVEGREYGVELQETNRGRPGSGSV
ncbi:hypothetical protein GOP47_0009864 [Adiantum capillus-veneris]|uniref:Uncharacterized protein n=1 Tax=Adiantum capillus-veneris TaxID=13818 RepID=A0A9D4ZHJ0_ADICA|nr:hypothetical protein GOP47_0009864 [Adiantum capillus-veneris]